MVHYGISRILHSGISRMLHYGISRIFVLFSIGRYLYPEYDAIEWSCGTIFSC